MGIEIFATAVLTFVIFACTNEGNTAVPNGSAGTLIALTIGVLNTLFGPMTGPSINPARDLGPKLFCWMGILCSYGFSGIYYWTFHWWATWSLSCRFILRCVILFRHFLMKMFCLCKVNDILSSSNQLLFNIKCFL